MPRTRNVKQNDKKNFSACFRVLVHQRCRYHDAKDERKESVKYKLLISIIIVFVCFVSVQGEAGDPGVPGESVHVFTYPFSVWAFFIKIGQTGLCLVFFLPGFTWKRWSSRP